MKITPIKRIALYLCCLLTVCLLLPPLTARAAGKADVQQVIDDVLAYKCRSAGAADIGALIDGDLTANAGVTGDWYVFGLKQYGFRHDYSGFSAALKRFADNNEVESPVTDERIALLFACLGAEPGYIAEVMDSAIGQLGVMSYVYGLHLLNNGYTSRHTTASAVVNALLDKQLADGGWAVMGEYGDVDVTAMTLAALAPHAASDAAVRRAADQAVAFLSSRQLENGGFKTYGQESPESAAQVIVALTSLGIDPLTDGDFVKGGHTAFDAMLSFRLSDGSFEHVHGKGGNHTATVQAFYSSVALYRFLNGQPGLYMLSAGESPAPDPTTRQAAAPQTAPAAPTAKQAEPAATQAPSVTAAPQSATTGSATTATAATTAAGTTTATTEPGEAISVIRPEKRATLPDFGGGEKTEATLTDATGTDAEKTGGAGYYIGGAVGIAAVAAAVVAVLVKKKKR